MPHALGIHRKVCNSDPVIAPGDCDGNGHTDLMNVRVNGGQVEWWLLEHNGGSQVVNWGAIIPGFGEFVPK